MKEYSNEPQSRPHNIQEKMANKWQTTIKGGRGLLKCIFEEFLNTITKQINSWDTFLQHITGYEAKKKTQHLKQIFTSNSGR